MICRAYAIGVFPMARSRHDALFEWIAPLERGILPLEAFHVPRKMRRLIRQRRFRVTVDRAFHTVISECAAPRESSQETWINDSIQRVFCRLHDLNLAHSIETWLDDRLIGGLYGLALGGAFFGESMFSRQTNASKVALVYLVALLRRSGFSLLDAQFPSEHLAQFGAIVVPMAAYLRLLDNAVQSGAVFQRDVEPSDWSAAVEELLAQSMSQTS